MKGDGFTDTNGNFAVDSLDTGGYSVESNDRSGLAVLSRCSISTGHHSVEIGADTLRPYASVKGEINTGAAPGASWYVQVYGLDRLCSVDATGSFTINDLPAGTFDSGPCAAIPPCSR